MDRYVSSGWTTTRRLVVCLVCGASVASAQPAPEATHQAAGAGISPRIDPDMFVVPTPTPIPAPPVAPAAQAPPPVQLTCRRGDTLVGSLTSRTDPGSQSWTQCQEPNQTKNGPAIWLWMDPTPHYARIENYDHGYEDGEFFEFAENGTMISERRFAKGVAVGPHRTWSASGQPRSDGAFVDGKREGLHRRWSDLGFLAEALTYVHDQLRGNQWYFDDNGQPRMERRLDASGAELRSIEWKSGDLFVTELDRSRRFLRGVLVRYCELVKRQKHGRCIDYSATGTLERMCVYVNDVQHGPCLEYHPGGQLRSTLTYDHGRKEGARETFDEGGNLVGRQTYRNDDATGPAYLRAGGPDDFEGAYVGGKPDGPWKYYQAGTLVAHGEFDRGIKVGTWLEVDGERTYDPKGETSWFPVSGDISSHWQWRGDRVSSELRVFVGHPLGRVSSSADDYRAARWTIGGDVTVGQSFAAGWSDPRTRFTVGPALRLGLATGQIWERKAEVPNVEGYVRVTPFVGTEDHALVTGVRVGVGINLFAMTNWTVRRDRRSHDDGGAPRDKDAEDLRFAEVVLRLPFMVIQHLELTTELEPRAGSLASSLGFSVGFGF